MGKQSARMVYRGKDHKDIYYQGHYHNAMYKGNRLVWRKLYDRYCSFSANRVIDLESQEIIVGSESPYIYSAIQHNDGYSISIFTARETKEHFIAFSSDLIKWKRVKELDKIMDDEYYIRTIFVANFDGFWAYQVGRNFVYFIEIDNYDDSYTVKEIETTISNLFPYQIGGVSNNFYSITANTTYEYTFYIAKKNGEFLAKKMGYPFDTFDTAPVPLMIIANTEDHIYIMSNYKTTYTSRTYLFHFSDFDTDFISTAFDSYRSSYFEHSRVGIDVIYSDSSQILLLFHNGIEKIEYGPTYVHDDWYDNMAFYRIGPSGNLEFILQKDENKDLEIPLYGSNRHDTFRLRLLMDKYLPPNMINPIDEGTAYYSQLNKGSASDYINTSLEIVENYRNFECIIGKYENSDGILVVYIDNLFFEESERNFAFIIKK